MNYNVSNQSFQNAIRYLQAYKEAAEPKTEDSIRAAYSAHFGRIDPATLQDYKVLATSVTGGNITNVTDANLNNMVVGFYNQRNKDADNAFVRQLRAGLNFGSIKFGDVSTADKARYQRITGFDLATDTLAQPKLFDISGKKYTAYQIRNKNMQGREKVKKGFMGAGKVLGVLVFSLLFAVLAGTFLAPLLTGLLPGLALATTATIANIFTVAGAVGGAVFGARSKLNPFTNFRENSKQKLEELNQVQREVDDLAVENNEANEKQVQAGNELGQARSLYNNWFGSQRGAAQQRATSHFTQANNSSMDVNEDELNNVDIPDLAGEDQNNPTGRPAQPTMQRTSAPVADTPVEENEDDQFSNFIFNADENEDDSVAQPANVVKPAEEEPIVVESEVPSAPIDTSVAETPANKIDDEENEDDIFMSQNMIDTLLADEERKAEERKAKAAEKAVEAEAAKLAEQRAKAEEAKRAEEKQKAAEAREKAEAKAREEKMRDALLGTLNPMNGGTVDERLARRVAQDRQEAKANVTETPAEPKKSAQTAVTVYEEPLREQLRKRQAEKQRQIDEYEANKAKFEEAMAKAEEGRRVAEQKAIAEEAKKTEKQRKVEAENDARKQAIADDVINPFKRTHEQILTDKLIKAERSKLVKGGETALAVKGETRMTVYQSANQKYEEENKTSKTNGISVEEARDRLEEWTGYKEMALEDLNALGFGTNEIQNGFETGQKVGAIQNERKKLVEQYKKASTTEKSKLGARIAELEREVKELTSRSKASGIDFYDTQQRELLIVLAESENMIAQYTTILVNSGEFDLQEAKIKEHEDKVAAGAVDARSMSILDTATVKLVTEEANRYKLHSKKFEELLAYADLFLDDSRRIFRYGHERVSSTEGRRSVESRSTQNFISVLPKAKTTREASEIDLVNGMFAESSKESCKRAVSVAIDQAKTLVAMDIYVYAQESNLPFKAKNAVNSKIGDEYVNAELAKFVKGLPTDAQIAEAIKAKKVGELLNGVEQLTIGFVQDYSKRINVSINLADAKKPRKERPVTDETFAIKGSKTTLHHVTSIGPEIWYLQANNAGKTHIEIVNDENAGKALAAKQIADQKAEMMQKRAEKVRAEKLAEARRQRAEANKRRNEIIKNSLGTDEDGNVIYRGEDGKIHILDGGENF